MFTAGSIVFRGMVVLKPMETPLDTIISLVSYVNMADEKFFNFTPLHHKIFSKVATMGLKTSSLNFQINWLDELRYINIYLGLIDKHTYITMDKA